MESRDFIRISVFRHRLRPLTLFQHARFVVSAAKPEDFPPERGPELAFAGRSNVGKSSAINALTHRKRLAFVSRTPGRTQTINFFDCGEHRRLVDLPGYGYAAVPQRERAHWGYLISTYLQQRASLKGLVLIVDSRHALTALDRQLIAWYAPSGLPLLALLTKSDKLGRQEAAQALRSARAALAELHPAAAVQLFSATAGTGVGLAQRVVYGWLK